MHFYLNDPCVNYIPFNWKVDCLVLQFLVWTFVHIVVFWGKNRYMCDNMIYVSNKKTKKNYSFLLFLVGKHDDNTTIQIILLSLAVDRKTRIFLVFHLLQLHNWQEQFSNCLHKTYCTNNDHLLRYSNSQTQSVKKWLSHFVNNSIISAIKW